MLVTFTCDAYENITVFGDVALRLLTMMGQSGVVPGALLADDVAAALVNLEQAILATKNIKSPLNDAFDDEEPEVSLQHRALPLIQLLRAAMTKGTHVMWS